MDCFVFLKKCNTNIQLFEELYKIIYVTAILCLISKSFPESISMLRLLYRFTLGGEEESVPYRYICTVRIKKNE